MTQAKAGEFDHLINTALDSFADMSPRDIVVGTVLPLLNTGTIGQVSQGTLARMMNVLARHADECAALGVEPNQDDLDAGYELIKHAKIPDSFSRQLKIFRRELEKKFAGYDFFRGKNLDDRLRASVVESFARQFLKDFSQTHNMHDVPALEIVDDPDATFSGQCAAYADGTCVFTLNLAQLKEVRDVVKLGIVLGHEAMHAYGRAVTFGRADTSYFDQDWQAQFTTMQAFNLLFYSLRPDVYSQHVEEHLAEISGVALAVGMAKAFGFPIVAADFEMSLKYLTPQVVADIINDAKDSGAAPAIPIRPAADSPPRFRG